MHFLANKNKLEINLNVLLNIALLFIGFTCATFASAALKETNNI